MNNQTIIGKYYIQNKIGNGQFGTVYSGKNLKTGEKIAIKTEYKTTEYKVLKHETTILNHLYNNGCRCTPMVYWYGIHNNFTCLIMPLYQTSLDKYILEYAEISLQQLNRIMSKLIGILKIIHSHYVIHRDIKPQNFMLSYDDITSPNKDLFIIDFGMATIYVDEYKKHLEINSEKKEYVIGNPKFMSYNIHSGINSSRRDDLISLGYIYLYFIIGKLPWNTEDGSQYIPVSDTVSELSVHHSKNIYRMKNKEWRRLSEWILLIMEENTQSENIEFAESLGKIHRYLEYCYGLGFSTSPLYDELSVIFLS